MYTVVQKPDIPRHSKRADKPPLEVIDHRRGGQKEQETNIEEAYEKLRRQREALQEVEIKYQKRIKELEKDAAELAKAQEATNIENKSLKNFLQRGPKASNIKKVKQQNSELQDVIKKLHEENKDLVQLINRMEKRDEDEWKNVFEETRRRQEERYSVVGPFVAGLNGKKGTITLNDLPSQKAQDDYDRQLEKMSKETKNLLHKFEQMKRMKGSIDYATVMGSTFRGSNIIKHRAIGDKVNMDLNKYSARLEELTSRHEKMTETLITSLSTKPKRKAKKTAKVSLEDANEKVYIDTSKPDVANNDHDVKKKTNIRAKSASTFLTEVPSNADKDNGSSIVSDTENDATGERKTKIRKIGGNIKSGTTNTNRENYKQKTQSKKPKESKHAKSASSANTKGILKGQENMKREENVKFDVEIERNIDRSDKEKTSNTKSKLEQNWDMQREKMKDVQSMKSGRSASKSASTVRKKATQPVKIKSELDNYNDEGTLFIKREDKKRPSLKETETNKSYPTKPRSPLVYQNVLKQISANDVSSKLFQGKEDTLTKNRVKEAFRTPRQDQRNNEKEMDGGPVSTGRYSHGPEPLTKSSQTLALIPGPNTNQAKKNKPFSNTAPGIATFGSVGTKGQNIEKQKVHAEQSQVLASKRRESKVSIPIQGFDSITEPRSTKSSARSPRTFPKHPPIHKDSIHLEKAPNSKTLLKYLRTNAGGSPLDFNERFTDQEDQRHTPAPIGFRDDARTLKQQNIRFVTHDEHIRPEIDERRGEYYRSYLTAT